MLTAMVSFQNWRKQPAAVVLAARDDDGSYTGALPPTPGLKPTPPSIAQLAFPSPDESSSPSCSSNTSHELERYDVAAPRQPNRLRKPPPSSYPFSFVPEDPSPDANFPYSFHRHRSTPNSPATSFVSGPARALSLHPPMPPRKLTKRRTFISDAPATAAANLSLPSLPEMPTLQRRNTFNFSLRRKKTSSKSTLSEDGHSMLPALPPPSPLTLNIVSVLVPFFLPSQSYTLHCSRPSGLSMPADAIPGMFSLLPRRLSNRATPAPLHAATCSPR